MLADKAATTQYTMMYAADKAAPVQAASQTNHVQTIIQNIYIQHT